MQPCTVLIKPKFITNLFQYVAGHVQLQQWTVFAVPLMQNLHRNVQILCMAYVYNMYVGMYTNFTS